MKYLKIFEEFNNLLPYDIKNLYDQISLYKLADRIYSIVVKDSHLRAMIFLRFQEYYESSSNEFKGQKFKWDRYIQWYKSSDSPEGEKECFTYGEDWTGFNIPSEAIEHCLSNIDDRGPYDDIMTTIINTIRKRESGNFYLLGIEELGANSWVLDHEMAHGFYYTDIEYRNSVNNLIKTLPNKEKIDISNVILELGYNQSVVNDEIQAYMSTGIYRKMNDSLKKYTPRFEDNFSRFKKIHNASPIKISIDFKISENFNPYDDEPLSRVEQHFRKQTRLEKQFSEIVVDGLCGEDDLFWSTFTALKIEILYIIEEDDPIYKELMHRVVEGEDPVLVMNDTCEKLSHTPEMTRLLKKLNSL